MNLNKKVAGLN